MNYGLYSLLVSVCLTVGTTYSIKINFEQQYNAEIEAYSSGRLSEQNEQFIQDIADQVDECKFIQVRQPSAKLIELHPQAQFNCFLPNVRYAFINETYFNLLPDHAKKFLISCYLTTPQMQAGRNQIQDIQRQKKFVYYAAGACELVTSVYIADKYIPTDWLYFNALKKYRPIAFFSKAFMTSLVLDAIADNALLKPVMRFFDSRIQNIESDLKKIHLKQFDCLDGALAYYEYMLIAIAPLVEEEPGYWKPLYTLFQTELEFYKAYKAFLDQPKQ